MELVTESGVAEICARSEGCGESIDIWFEVMGRVNLDEEMESILVMARTSEICK